MKNSLGLKSLSYITVAFFLFLSSCKDNDKIDFTSNDNANVQSEATTDSQTEETDDMASVAVASDASTLSGREEFGGRSITINDERFKCAKSIVIETASDNSQARPHGYITVDFGDGCTGPGGRKRKGIIKIEYIGRRFMPSSQIITTFTNYSVNDIKIEGTRTLTNTSESITAPVSFSIVETGVKLTFPDGSTATRSVDRRRVWNRTNNPIEDSWTVTGSASGTNRRGREYTMVITKPLVYKRSCAVTNKVFIAVEGTKELVVDSKKITIDYGSGECDNKVSITVNGKSKEVEASADGN